MPILSSALGAAALATIPRVPGSVARIGADIKAPDDIRDKTVGREALHLGSSMVLPALFSPILTKQMPKLFKSSPFLASGMGATMMAAVIGLTGAEIISRHFFPTAKWSERTNLMSHEDDDFDDDHHEQEHDDVPRVGSKLDVTALKDPPSFSQAFSTSTYPAARFPLSATRTSQMFNAPVPRTAFSVSV